MKTVSILGCGWLGKPLAKYLTDKNYLVKGSTTRKAKIDILKQLGISPFLIDISSNEISKEFLNTDILIIAITSKNVENFKRLISQIENSQTQKVLFISSTSVYGRINKVMTEEDAILETPLSQIETLFRNTHKFETTILRFAGLFGLHRNPGNWFSKGRKIPQPNGFVNMIHLEDCIGIIENIIRKNKWNEVFNACSNHHPTRKDFYTKAKKKIGLEVPVFEENEELKYKIISSKKIQKALNYQFIHDNLLEIQPIEKE